MALHLVEKLLFADGALVERDGEWAHVVLPDELQVAYELPELATLDPAGVDGAPCGYGSELLRRAVDRSLARGAVAAAIARVDAPRAGEPPHTGLNVALRPGAPVSITTWTLVGHFLADAHADDRREAVVSAAVCLMTGAPVPPPVGIDLLDTEERPDAALITAAEGPLLREARRAALEALAPFRAAVARRHRRDVLRVGRYFEDMDRDLEALSQRSKGAALAAKRATLPAERERRLRALAETHTVHLALRPVALLLVRHPVAEVPLTVLRRKRRRVVPVLYDGLSRRWQPLVCEGCADAVLSFGACDDEVHVLCGRCLSEKGCPACAGRREPPPVVLAGATEAVATDTGQVVPGTTAASDMVAGSTARKATASPPAAGAAPAGAAAGSTARKAAASAPAASGAAPAGAAAESTARKAAASPPAASGAAPAGAAAGAPAGQGAAARPSAAAPPRPTPAPELPRPTPAPERQRPAPGSQLHLFPMAPTSPASGASSSPASPAAGAVLASPAAPALSGDSDNATLQDIVRLVRSGPQWRAEQLRHATGASPELLRRVLQHLMELGLIEKGGRARGTWYRWIGAQ